MFLHHLSFSISLDRSMWLYAVIVDYVHTMFVYLMNVDIPSSLSIHVFQALLLEISPTVGR